MADPFRKTWSEWGLLLRLGDSTAARHMLQRANGLRHARKQNPEHMRMMANARWAKYRARKREHAAVEARTNAMLERAADQVDAVLAEIHRKARQDLEQ